MKLLWDFLIGPLLALLPARWRSGLVEMGELEWTRAGIMSGIYEVLASVIAIGYWYYAQMTRSLEQIMQAAAQSGADEHAMGGAALFLFYLHPLTWLMFFFFFEGAVRTGAAVATEKVHGSFPLYVVDRLLFWVRHPGEARVGEQVREHGSSFAESIREWLMVARLKEVEDEVEYSKRGEDDFLEIHASRRKKEWVEPLIVRVEGSYYRLDESWVGKGERPFCYRLKQLPAGVPGRKVIQYDP